MISNLLQTINKDIPEFESMDSGIDFLMDYLLELSEDLDSKSFFVNKRWIEVRDNVQFQEKILHVFNEDGIYMRILEGDIVEGTWELSIGGFIIKHSGTHELYECVFLNDDYFILKKHGDHTVKAYRNKYFFMTKEALADQYEWNELLLELFSSYKSNAKYILVILMLVAFVLLVLIFSLS